MRRYFEFSGRSTRSEYWLYTLVYFVIYVIAVIIDAFVFGMHAAHGIGIVSGIVGLVHFIPSLAVSFRRLHDTDRSAWWILILLVPLIGFVWLIVLYCMPSTPGPNRFGPHPAT